MNSVKVQNLILTSHGVKPQTVKPKTGGYATQSTPAQSVSFQGGSSSISKRGWFFLRNLSDYMKDASEITNAIIATLKKTFFTFINFSPFLPIYILLFNILHVF